MMKFILLLACFSASLCFSADALSDAKEECFEIAIQDIELEAERFNYVLKAGETKANSPKLQEFDRRRETLNRQIDKLRRMIERNNLKKADVESVYEERAKEWAAIRRKNKTFQGVELSHFKL